MSRIPQGCEHSTASYVLNISQNTSTGAHSRLGDPVGLSLKGREGQQEFGVYRTTVTFLWWVFEQLPLSMIWVFCLSLGKNNHCWFVSRKGEERFLFLLRNREWRVITAQERTDPWSRICSLSTPCCQRPNLSQICDCSIPIPNSLLLRTYP